MEVAQNALKHGVTVRDMHHAIRNPVRRWNHDDRKVLIIGPDYRGDLLEVAFVDDDPEEEPVIVHAMP